MKTEQSCYSVAEMCLTLGVSRSGLYDHTQKNQRNRRQQDATLAEQIAVIFVQSRNTYGCRRIQQMLRRQGIQCGKNRIRRLMDEQALQAVQKRRFRPPTTQSRHDQPIAPNRLKELPEPPQRPNQVWTGDITSIPSQQEGWLYLAAEMDLCSKRLAGWKLDHSLAAPLVLEAFERAVRSWSTAPQLHHSDRGVQYAAQDFRKALQQSNKPTKLINCLSAFSKTDQWRSGPRATTSFELPVLFEFRAVSRRHLGRTFRNTPSFRLR